MKIIQLNEKHTHLLVELIGCVQYEYVSLTFSEWSEIIRDGTLVWGIIENNHLVATGSITFYDNDGHQICYNHACTAVLTNSAVHPKYRGKNYQAMLIRHRVGFILEHTKVREIISLVQKDNKHSIRNLVSEDFVYKCKYPGKEDADGYMYEGPKHFLYWKIKNFFKSL